MFDLMTAVAPKINAGAFYQLTDPSGAPLYDDLKQPVGVTLLARNSDRGLATMRANGNRRLAEARRGSSSMTIESSEAEGSEVLVACTVSWTFDTMNGEPFPCTEANARKFWSDDRFRRWRAGAEEFIASEANFTKA